MTSNGWNALRALMGGAGLIVLLIGLFTDYYDWGFGLILAMAIWISLGALESWRKKKSAQAGLAALLGGVGVVLFLIGIFTDWYDFWIGFILAMIAWVLAGVLKKLWGIKDDDKCCGDHEHHHHDHEGHDHKHEDGHDHGDHKPE